MIPLANAELTVDLLDPAAEHARLGPRFCWGGYIWQVSDRNIGTLLTGPEWPELTPLPHNGQGLPESFRHSTTEGRPLLWKDNQGLAPGGGELTRDASGTVTVSEPCKWEIENRPDRIVFRTQQSALGWSYAVERTIELRGRQLVSRSKLTNTGTTRLTLEWFAHPFFALETDGKLRAQLPLGTALPANEGYDLAKGELTFRRKFIGLHDGCLVQLEQPAGKNFSVQLTHPQLQWVRFATDFVPFKTVLWANGNTLSFEPYLALDLAPGQSREWTLTYDFGPAR